MRNNLFKSTFSAVVYTALIVATLSFVCPAKADTFTPLPPQNPVISRFNDAITFYSSFDGYVTADLSDGNGTPQKGEDRTEWDNGIYNKALRSLAGPVQYEAKDNIDLTAPGGVVMWVSPQNWTHKSPPGYINFILVNYQGVTLQISRMGSLVNTEKLYAWFKTRNKGAIANNGSSLKWDSGWHLLAANWGSGYVEFSLDGSAFNRAVATVTTPYSGKDPGIISVGSGGAGSYPFLTDELFIFNRPLTNDEVQWIYQQNNDLQDH